MDHDESRLARPGLPCLERKMHPPPQRPIMSVMFTSGLVFIWPDVGGRWRTGGNISPVWGDGKRSEAGAEWGESRCGKRAGAHARRFPAMPLPGVPHATVRPAIMLGHSRFDRRLTQSLVPSVPSVPSEGVIRELVPVRSPFLRTRRCGGTSRSGDSAIRPGGSHRDS